MNADWRQAGARIHSVDALDLPHIDQMGHVPAYDNFQLLPNSHGDVQRIVFEARRDDTSPNVLVRQHGTLHCHWQYPQRQTNLYYLHWWTLTYSVFETPQHRDRALALVQRGGGLDAFEQLNGPVETVQAEWQTYVCRLKAALAGSDLEFFKSRRRLGSTNAPPNL
jgi:hypothetical protein